MQGHNEPPLRQAPARLDAAAGSNPLFPLSRCANLHTPLTQRVPPFLFQTLRNGRLINDGLHDICAICPMELEKCKIPSRGSSLKEWLPLVVLPLQLLQQLHRPDLKHPCHLPTGRQMLDGVLNASSARIWTHSSMLTVFVWTLLFRQHFVGFSIISYSAPLLRHKGCFLLSKETNDWSKRRENR
jgi:hypothetical protein